MKLLILSRDFSHRGGVVNYIRILINNLPQDQFEIKHFIQGKIPGFWENVSLPIVIIAQLINFKNKLDKFKPDIVHINPSFHFNALIRDSFYMGFLGKFYQNKSLIMFHGWDVKLAEKISKNILLKVLFQQSFRKAALILTLSRKYKQQLVKIGICHEHIRVTTTMYENVSSIEHEQNKSEDNKINILFMSRLIKPKGTRIIADVGKRLAESGYCNFSITIAGAGPEYEFLARFIENKGLKDYICLTGYVKDDLKAEILEKSDIFLFPSVLDEGCPIAVLEAMGAGVAIICSSVGAVPDLVEHNVHGLLIKSVESWEFYKGVLKLIQDRPLLQKMKAACRKHARENYAAEVVTVKMIGNYQRIIKNDRIE